ncbi:unnamed protein product [Chrysoparadoxa australica]
MRIRAGGLLGLIEAGVVLTCGAGFTLRPTCPYPTLWPHACCRPPPLKAKAPWTSNGPEDEDYYDEDIYESEGGGDYDDYGGRYDSDYGADDEGEYGDRGGRRKSRRRVRSVSSFDALRYLNDGEAEAEDYKNYRMDWYKKRNSEPGGFMGWMRNLYDALFWYGAALDDDEFLPAMDFKDLMEMYEVSSPPGARMEPHTTEQEQEQEDSWQYRWRPSTKGKQSGSRRDQREAERDYFETSRQARRAPQGPSSGGGLSQSEQRLRQKLQRLKKREKALLTDLGKVDERLSVVDATLELWLRRSKAMSRATQGNNEELTMAKRRIYGLRDEGKRLDVARAELEHQLGNTQANYARIRQELGNLLGEEIEDEEEVDEGKLSDQEQLTELADQTRLPQPEPVKLDELAP